MLDVLVSIPFQFDGVAHLHGIPDDTVEEGAELDRDIPLIRQGNGQFGVGVFKTVIGCSQFHAGGAIVHLYSVFNVRVKGEVIGKGVREGQGCAVAQVKRVFVDIHLEKQIALVGGISLCAFGEERLVAIPLAPRFAGVGDLSAIDEGFGIVGQRQRCSGGVVEWSAAALGILPCGK